MTRRTPTQPETPSPWFRLGAALADVVFAPDYYAGPWYVQVTGERSHRTLWRNCRNHATAQAWARYLRRHDYRGISIGKGQHPRSGGAQ